MSELMPETIFETDAKGNLTFMNETALRLFGYTIKAFEKGLNAQQLFIPEDRERVKKNFQRRSEGKKSDISEYTALKKDGSKFPVIIHSSPIFSENKPVGLREILVDITKYKQAKKALPQRVEMAQALTNASTESIILIDRQGTILTANETAARRLGKSVEELIGLHPEDLVSESLSPVLIKSRMTQIEEVIRTGKPVRYEAEENGKYFDINICPIFNAIGEVVQLAIYSNDITERKKARQALQESEERHLAVWENSPIGICLTDKDGVYHYANPAYCRMYGYSEEELVGRSFYDIIVPPGPPKKARVRHDRLFALRKPVPFGETEFIRKNGERIWIQYTGDFFWRDNKPQFLVSLNVDITEHKRAEEELKESEEKYRTLVENTNDIIFTVDLKGNFLFVNKAFKKILGYSDKEIKKINGFKLIHPEDLKTVEKQFAKLIEGKRVDNMEYRYKTKYGSYVNILNNASPIFDSQGDVVSAFGIARDITERKQVEEKLRLFSHSVECSIDGIAMGDPNSRITYVNETFAEMFGYSNEELIGKKITFLYPKDQIPRLEKAIKATLEGSWTGELLAQKKNGEVFPIAVSSARVVDDKGNLIAQMASHKDITVAKKNESHDKARLQLLNNLRTTIDVDDCLRLGCKAIYESGFFKRAVLTLHNDKREIVNIGQVGLNENVVREAKNAPAPDKALAKEIQQEKYRISHSFFIPEKSGLPLKETPRYIPQTDSTKIKNPSWEAGDELFVPIIGDDSKYKGWLSVDTPFDGKRPTSDIVICLEEIVDMVIRKVHQIQSLEQLDKEQQALQEKNIALKEVLTHIESEKLDFRKQIANNIDQIIMPALMKLRNNNGALNETIYNFLKDSLQNLASSTGGALHLYSKLSPREAEICSLIKGGFTSKEIAEALHLSPATVKKHRELTRKKLGLTNKEINLTSYLKNM